MEKNKMLEYNIKLNKEFWYQEYIREGNKISWRLQRNIFDIHEIMNSENNTEEELKQFIKEHTLYDYVRVIGRVQIYTSIIVFLLQVINVKFFNLIEISCFVLGSLLMMWVEFITRSITNYHNNKVDEKIIEEDIEYIKKRKKEILKEMERKNDKKRNIPKDKKNK